MKYLALIMLVSSIFAGSASAHMYSFDEHPDAFVPLYSPAGNFVVPGPHAPMLFWHDNRAGEPILFMHR